MRKDLIRWLTAILVVIIAAILGTWLAKDALSKSRAGKDDSERPPRPYRQLERPAVASAKGDSGRESKGRGASLEDIYFGRAVRFDSEESYRAFLNRIKGSSFVLLGQIDALRAVRIGFGEGSNLADLDDLVGDDGKTEGNFLVSVPEFGTVGPGPGAQGFGRSTLEYLGVTGDNSTWGEGVRIAMLDTGVGEHSAFPERIREINLLPGDEPIPLNPHGTAVASLLVGQGSAQGLAPAADLLSIRIADDQGSSNSFLLAAGIIRAVDEGAQIINISMGSLGDSALVRDAVAYASERQVAIVASAGNEGISQTSYPAAYDGVIAVGAVDARGQILEFSNHDESVDLAAPGYEVAAAWGEEGVDDNRLFTGTSASAPIVTGAIAAATSEFGPIPIQNATNLVIENLNAAGQPGDDEFYGEGILDLGRVMNSETGGIYDGAIASNYYQEPTADDPVPRLQVTVENRGTEVLNNSSVDITINDGLFQMNVPSLRPGETHVLTLPVNVPTTTESIVIRSVLNLNGGGSDIKPANDIATGEIVLIEPVPDPSLPTDP